MPTLQRLKRRRRRVCVGDLDSRVRVYHRSQVPPAFGSVDAAFAFQAVSGDGYVWARVETVGGKTVFDGVAGDRRVTHEVTIRHLAGVTSESWVLLEDGTRLDVVLAEGLDERGEFLLLRCDARGSDALPASAL